jgi:hypothetical protein
MTAYRALTPKDVPICGGEKPTMKAALTWARQYGQSFPGARIIQQTKRGSRTIWRHDVSGFLPLVGE